MQSQYIGDKEAAKYLNIGIKKFRSIVNDDPDFPPPFQPGSRKRLHRPAELDAFMDKLRARDTEAG